MLTLLLVSTIGLAAPKESSEASALPDDPSSEDASTEVLSPFRESDESELFRLDEELVTVASKYAQTLRKAPSVVTLITAKHIRERGYRTVTDALRDLPGIYLWKSKEGRDLAAFRGVISADNNKFLLLVDGNPWYDGVYTHAFIDEYMPIAHVKQIEVIKGPGSAIYGTNAFSGVVNIVTYHGREIQGATVRWTVGSVGRSDLTVVAGGSHRIHNLEVQASAYGRWLSQMGDGLDLTPRGRRDVNGYDPKNGVAIGGRFSVAGLELQIHHVDYRHSYLVNEADDPYQILDKSPSSFGLFYHNTYFSGRWDLELTRDVTLSPYVYTHRSNNPGSYFFTDGFETEQTDDGFETEQQMTVVETEKDTRRWGAGVQVTLRPSVDHHTMAGIGIQTMEIVDGPDGAPGIVDFEYTNFDREPQSTGFEGRGKLRNLFAYAQHVWTVLPAMEVTVGGRFDIRFPTDPSQDRSAAVFHPSAAPRVSLLVVPTDQTTLKLLYGGAFRSPNIRELLVTTNELDEDGNYLFANGNLELRRERIDTTELEFSWTPVEFLDLRTSASYSLVTHEIDKLSPPNEYQNLPGGLHIFAGEAEALAHWKMFDLRLAYALTNARYGANAGSYASRLQYEFPPHMFKGRLVVRPIEQLVGTLTGELYTFRPRVEWTPDADLADGQGFGLLHGTLRMTELGKQKRWSIDLTVRNLTNTLWGTAIYRDDANATSGGEAKYPREIEGEGRTLMVGVEAML